MHDKQPLARGLNALQNRRRRKLRLIKARARIPWSPQKNERKREREEKVESKGWAPQPYPSLSPLLRRCSHARVITIPDLNFDRERVYILRRRARDQWLVLHKSACISYTSLMRSFTGWPSPVIQGWSSSFASSFTSSSSSSSSSSHRRKPQRKRMGEHAVCKRAMLHNISIAATAPDELLCAECIIAWAFDFSELRVKEREREKLSCKRGILCFTSFNYIGGGSLYAFVCSRYSVLLASVMPARRESRGRLEWYNEKITSDLWSFQWSLV